MASKKKQKGPVNTREGITVKYVKAANMWCRTTWSKGTQKQEWFVNKPV